MTFEEWKKSIVAGDGYSAEDAFDAATLAERERCAKVCREDESGRDGGCYFADLIEFGDKP